MCCLSMEQVSLSKKNKMKRTVYILIVMALLLSCGGQKDDRRVITVTIEPLRYFVEQLVEDKAEVVTLVPKGSSPENYEPTAQQMVALGNSMMFVKVGNLGFEQSWTEKLGDLAKDIVIVDSSEGIETIESQSRGVTDQHTWMSCANALVIVKNIYKALKASDPGNASFYEKRYDALVANIRQINDELSENMKTVKGTSFIIYHPALTYFAKEYGINQIAVEEEGREPSAASLAQVIDRAKAEGVKKMLVQQEFDRRNAEIVAKALNIGMTTINPLSYEWDQEMRNIGKILSSAQSETETSAKE